MDTNRVNRWASDIDQRMQRETLGDAQRGVYWLSEHIGEYLQRWLGFASDCRLTVSDTFGNDAFCIIVGAANVMEKRVKEGAGMPLFPAAAWDSFVNSLDFIQAYPEKENLSVVANCYDCFLSALPARSHTRSGA